MPDSAVVWHPPFSGGIFLFDRKVHFLSNKKTRLCTLARGEIIADATALGAGVRQGAHFFYLTEEYAGSII